MGMIEWIPSKFFSLQARKPSGFFGRFFITPLLKLGNIALNNFVRETLTIQNGDRILELGFGPGKLIHAIAKESMAAHVEGVDFSEIMFKEAEKLNAPFIREGRVKLHCADFNTLPFEEDTFDKICTVNTLYFWEEPEKILLEIKRVLKPGGKLVIGFRDDVQIEKMHTHPDVFKVYTLQEATGLLSQAGFREARIEEKGVSPNQCYCAVAVT